MGTSADSGPAHAFEIGVQQQQQQHRPHTQAHKHTRTERKIDAGNDGIVSEKDSKAHSPSCAHTDSQTYGLDWALFVLALCRVVKIENCLRANVIVFLWGYLYTSCAMCIKTSTRRLCSGHKSRLWGRSSSNCWCVVWLLIEGGQSAKWIESVDVLLHINRCQSFIYIFISSVFSTHSCQRNSYRFMNSTEWRHLHWDTYGFRLRFRFQFCEAKK